VKQNSPGIFKFRVSRFRLFGLYDFNFYFSNFKKTENKKPGKIQKVNIIRRTKLYLKPGDL
jgi:hypothetical protein